MWSFLESNFSSLVLALRTFKRHYKAFSPMPILQYTCAGKKEKEKKRSHKDRRANLSEEEDVSGSESSREKADLDQLLTRTAPRYVLS